MAAPEILTDSAHPLNSEGYANHQWNIESPEGATSIGTCDLCGEQREFRNSFGGHLWEIDNPQPGQTWRKGEQIRITKSIHSDGNELE